MMQFVRREPFPSSLGRKQRGGEGIERSCIPDRERSRESLYDYYKNLLSVSRSSAHVRVLSSASLHVLVEAVLLPSKFWTHWNIRSLLVAFTGSSQSVTLPRSKFRSEHVQICTVWILGGRNSAGTLSKYNVYSIVFFILQKWLTFTLFFSC